MFALMDRVLTDREEAEQQGRLNAAMNQATIGLVPTLITFGIKCCITLLNEAQEDGEFESAIAALQEMLDV